MDIQVASRPFNTNFGTCSVCKKKESKYICPKCSVNYCCIGCYKGHSQDCIEGFYKEQVIQGLQGRKVGKGAAQEVGEMIRRTEELPDAVLDEIKDEIFMSRVKQLQKILENSQNCLDVLTETEKNEFFQFIDSGKVVKYLEEWIPWWCDTEKDWCLEICASSAYIDAPSIEKLCKKPSGFLIFHIFEAVWSIIYTWRMVNGEITENQEEVTRTLISISQVINGANCEYTGFDSVFQVIISKVVKNNPEIGKGLVHPVNFDCLSVFSSKWKVIKLNYLRVRE